MQNKKILTALVDLGKFLHLFVLKNEEEYTPDEQNFSALLQKAQIENPWFTRENFKICLKNWADNLRKEKLENWLTTYQFSENSKKVGLILAGNIPLVGFHDVVCVLLSNHIPLIKLSSKDKTVLPFLLEKWNQYSGNILKYEIVERLEKYDAVIATGSNNTARYLEYYFKNVLSLIRKNRTSVAILDGNETDEDLQNLAKDIFTYFGLGCRNVTKILISENFNLDRLFSNFLSYQDIINHHLYANNYDYNKAIYLLNQDLFWDNNFVMMREDEKLFSPLSVINFTRYKSKEEVITYLQSYEEEIQCKVAHPSLQIEGSIAFGEAQNPSIDTYADNVDTMKFLEVI